SSMPLLHFFFFAFFALIQFYPNLFFTSHLNLWLSCLSFAPLFFCIPSTLSFLSPRVSHLAVSPLFALCGILSLSAIGHSPLSFSLIPLGEDGMARLKKPFALRNQDVPLSLPLSLSPSLSLPLS